MSIGDTVYEEIRTDILFGAFEPGAKLKLEGLRQRYDVSINTLRESLARLSSDRLVLAEGQKGFRVVPVSLSDLRDITEMRQLLECHALRRAIERGDLEWEGRIVAAHHKLARIERIMVEDEAKHAPEWERHNREFHIALISACGSSWLLNFHRALYDQSLRYRMLSIKTKPFPREQSAREHAEILDLVLKRDADAASALLAMHITKGAELPADEPDFLKWPPAGGGSPRERDGRADARSIRLCP
jgi:DNA-binding GntR family transcriptional regulator